MYPNLFVIGAAKSGTTSLHFYLAQHPEIHMSVEKEPNYFSYAGAPSDGPSHVISDNVAYQRLFETELPVRGESSVTYSFWPYPAGVPERIHAVAPDARFIYLVRDPVDRAMSHYRHRVVLGQEDRSIREVMEQPHESRERYLTASSYATQLEQYLKIFPLERFLVIDQSELLASRELTLRQCFQFLGVDADFSSQEWSRQLNETSSQRQYSTLANRIRLSPSYRRTLGWLSPDARDRVLAPARALLTREVRDHDEMDDGVRAYFSDRLADEAARFRELTGRPFTSWSV